MRKWKKAICAVLSAMMVMGTTADASSAVAERTTTQDSSYIKKYNKINDISDKTILGADFSDYQQNLEWNKIYYDYKGVKTDSVFNFVKAQGVNTVSVKVAVNPEGGLAYLSLDNAIKTVKAAKEAGLNTNMILMYSDGITYKDVQTLPKTWNAADAANEAKAYTETLLAKLKTENAAPTMITVGNEVNYDFLGYTATDSWQGWYAMGAISKLVKAEGIKVAVGIAAPTAAADIEWVAKELNDQYAEIDYDYVGVSIYPNADTISYMDTLRTTFETVNADKQLFVSGVKYPRVSDTDTTVGVESQADNIYKLLDATVTDKNAGGLIYDDAVFVGSWNSFFDAEGNAQTSLAIFAYAQGNQVDVDTYRDPFKYGGETGLKNQQVDIKKIDGMTESAIRGMDIGSYIALKEAGVKYYNHKGEEEDLLKILHDNGVNYIRIRIWNDPKNEKGETYGGGNCDVATGLKIAKEAKKYGMKILLCFHYSDFWADPGAQLIPKAWDADKDNTEKMSQNVYEFTKDTVQQFKDAGADLGMVQVGNEISQGMIGIRDKSYNNIWGNYDNSSRITSYIKAGCKAVRETSPDTLIALHLESINYTKYKKIMDVWERDDVDYDILGTTFYPFWVGNNLDSALKTLKDVQTMAASRGKLFSVLETSWVNTLEDSDGTSNNIGSNKTGLLYDVSPQGQVDALSDVYKTVMAQENGLGAFYWEPSWIPVKAGWINWAENKESSDKYGTGWAAEGCKDYYSVKAYYNGRPTWGGTTWENQALFDPNGYALQSLKFYKDSISGGQEQTSVIHLVDAKGNEISGSKFAKVYLGCTRKINLPTVSGYVLQNPATTLKITGEVDGIQHYYVTYTKVQEIKSKKSSYTIKSGATLDLAKELTLAADSTLKYSSSNSNVVSIDAKTGKMTAKAVGTAVITISADKTAYSTAATKTINVTVSPKVVTTTIKAKKSSYKMAYGNSLNLAKELTINSKGTVKYTSSNSKVASVDAKTGKVTAKSVGKAVITVNVAKTGSNTAATKKINVTVSPKVEVKNKGVQNLAYGSSYKLSSYATVSGKCTKKFTSSNKSIAKVDKNGKITAVKPGKVTITMKVSASGVDTITKKVTVNVVPKKQKVTKVTAASKALTVNFNKDKMASGYQVMVSTDKNFKSNTKSVYISKNSTTKTTIKKLTAKKQYYVRVRSYKTISNKKCYGSWSSVSKMKTK